MRLFRELIEFLCACFIAYVVGWLFGIGAIIGAVMTIAFTISVLF